MTSGAVIQLSQAATIPCPGAVQSMWTRTVQEALLPHTRPYSHVHFDGIRWHADNNGHEAGCRSHQHIKGICRQRRCCFAYRAVSQASHELRLHVFEAGHHQQLGYVIGPGAGMGRGTCCVRDCVIVWNVTKVWMVLYITSRFEILTDLIRSCGVVPVRAHLVHVLISRL